MGGGAGGSVAKATLPTVAVTTVAKTIVPRSTTTGAAGGAAGGTIAAAAGGVVGALPLTARMTAEPGFAASAWSVRTAPDGNSRSVASDRVPSAVSSVT